MDYRDQDDLEQNLAQDQSFADEFSGSQPQILPIGQDVVTLPPGTSLASLEVQGRDLIIVLDDGSRIVVPDGAVFVPQIVVEGVAVPPLNVAQLLNENTPEPAAGATQSSGGNFADDEGAIQDAFDLGDLLPFTDFGFPEDREEEIIPNAVDREVDLVIQTPNEPAGAQNATAGVDEAGLPARANPAEPEGTDEPAASETTTGTIVFNAPDGVESVLINGVAVTGTGQTISSPTGTLTITSIDLATGEIGYSYSLDDNTLGDGNTDVFTVIVTDNDGDEATATLTITIVDDGPVAADDVGQVGAGSNATITGDVLANDVPGADNYATDGAVSSFGNDSGTAAPGSALQGEYGVLTINPDGSYTYIREPNTPGGVEESFTYTIVDQDGSTSSATLVIEIADAPDAFTEVPRIGEGTVVDEGGLPERGTEPPGTGEIADNDASNDSDTSETTGSTISFSSPDGVASITINGVVIDPTSLPQTIVSDASGTLVVTGYTYDPVTGDGTITYEFTLSDNTSGDDTAFDFDLVITDLDGDTASDTLTITVVDDEPEAVDDSGSQGVEGAPVTVDVFANDTPGADNVQPDEVALVDGSLSGAGSVTYNNDGSFTYSPAPGEEGTVTFDYTITDGDGDVATATVTIELLDDSEPEISVESEAQVDEAGLPARGSEPEGSDEASDSEIVSGSIAIDTGNDTVASLVINGVDVTTGGTVSTAKGDLVVSVSGGSYSYTYTLSDNTLTDPDSDSFLLTVTDSDGDNSSTTLVIAIVDDSPDAVDDSNALGAGEFGPVGGNVLGNDTQGADGANVTGYSGSGGSGNAGDVVQGTYGTLTIAADGTYSYTRDPGAPGGVSDTFSYTITDGDGDTSSALLVIAIADSPTTLDLPTAGEDGTLVQEDGLAGPPAGSNAASNNEITSGTFTYTAPDGPATVTIDGVVVTSVGQTFVGAHGTLTIDAIANGSVSYTYELTTSTSGDNTSDNFVVRVTDQDGDFSEDVLEIKILDDMPSASPDSDSVREDGPVVANGNVLTGAGGTDANATDGVPDVEGADGATVTAVAFGATTGTVGSALAGAYGQLTLDADGSYSYELENQNGLVQGLDGNDTLQEQFTYTITDGDGDTATTTLTIVINGNDDPVVLNGLDLQGPELSVDEDDLPDGSSPDAGALTKTGSFAVDSPDGLSTLTVGGVTVFDASTATTYPVVIDDPTYGLLTITGVTPVSDASGDIVSATIEYRYVLEDNSLLHTGNNDGSFVDSFAVVATDTDGSSDTASLDIEIIDDTPAASPDADTVTEDGPLTASGNVITDAEANGDNGADTPGADEAQVTGVIFGETTSPVSGSVGSLVAGAYGTLEIAADGVYTYTLDNTNPLVQGLDKNETLEETFSYTITDGDGDSATKSVKITINGADDPIVLSGLDVDPAELTVDEDDLLDGSSPDNAALTQTGNFTVTSPDGMAEVKAGGLTVWTDTGGFVAGQNITTAIGTFVITGVTPTTTDGNGDVTAATVTFSYVLNDNTLTHIVGGEDTILESFGIEVTDTDGSAASGSVDVLVVDDIPDVVASGNDAPTLVTDDSDIGGNVPPSDSANFAGLFTTLFGADGPSASDPVVYSLAINGGNGTDSSLDDTLSGDNILLRLNGDTIEGYLENSPATIAFTLELDPATGDITQTQVRAVEHDDPNDSAETQASGAAETLAANLVSLTATVTDGDGDMDSESIDIGGSFAFEDDGPGLRSVVVGIPLDEDDLVPDGNGDVALGDGSGTSLRTFTYHVDFGADGPNADEITASFLTAEGSDPSIGTLALTSGGAAVIFDWNPATNTLTGYTTDINDPVLTMQFDLVAGTMTLDYLKPLDHPSTDADGANDGPEAGYEDNILLNFEVVIKDGDGDTDTFQLRINIDDDMAVALADTASQQTENQSFTIDALINDAFGADGVDTTVAAKVFVSSQASQGTVTYDTGTGLFTYTPNAGAGSNGNTTDTFEYTIVDGDGDASTATVTVTLKPDSEPQGGENVATVDDDGLPGNNPLSTTGDLDANLGDHPGDTSEASFTGTISANVGSDTPASITFAAAMNGMSATIGQETVTYSIAGNVLTATITGGPRNGTDLFTVEILDNATGAYVVNLLDNVLQDAGNDENQAFASIDFTVADVDGDTALSNLGIVFDDDAPTASDEASQNVNEGATVSGTLDFVAGADGASVTHIGATALVFGPSGFSQSIDIGGGLIKVKADGSYEFTAEDPSISPASPTSATLTVTDDDGDTAIATVNFQVVDANVPTGGVTNATVDDDGLISGNPLSTAGDAIDANADGDNDESTFGGALVLNFGGDGPGSVGFASMDGLTAMVGQEMVTYSWNAGSNTLTATGPRGALFTVEVTNPATGAFEVTLVDNVLHAQGPNDENDALAALTYTVSDSDGSTATGTLNITFDDDGPSASAPTVSSTVSVDETSAVTPAGFPISATSTTAIVSATTAFGADGAAAGGGTSYAIDIVGGGVTALQTAIGDFPITLVQISATVIAGQYTDGGVQTAFTMEINADGTLTVTENVPLEHLIDGSAPADLNDALTLDGLVNATITVTDSDGDTASATAAIGGAVTFFDDGPTIDVSKGADAGVTLTTQDAQTDGDPTDTDTAVSTAGFGGVFSLSSTTGADGAAMPSLSYALSVTDAVSGLTSGGTAINLYEVGGVVVGSTALVAPASVTDASVVFTISVAADGVVTLSQLQQIDHPAGSDPSPTVAPFEDHLAILADGKVALTASATITDGDGDTATDSETVDLGGNIRFADDGPTVSAFADAGSVAALDETATTSGVSSISTGSIAKGDDPDVAGAGTISIATSVDAVVNAAALFGADGAAAANSLVYALTVTNTTSGLTVTDGAAINLVNEGGVIVGQVASGVFAGQAAFAIAIDGTTGVVTVEQYLSLDHPVSTDPDDTLALLTGSLGVTVTATDFDGDTAQTAAIDISAQITFNDDGPDAVVANAAAPMMVLDESPVGTETDGNNAPAGLASVTANFAGNFGATVDYGSDGAGSVSYALVLGTATGSGLFALGVNGAQGAEVDLVQTNATTITGSAGGTDYFTIAVNPTTGEVTFTQINNIWHGDTASDDEVATLTMASASELTLTQTVTDADGDSDSAAINLGVGVFKIEDDGPDAVVTNAVADVLVLDESPLAPNGDGIRTVTADLADNFGAVIDYGTDGSGTVSYELNLSADGIGSGLFALGTGGAQGAEILLTQAGDTITGSAGGTNYFTISINTTTGQITFEQLANIWHDEASDPDDQETLSLDGVGEFLRVEQTVTDADGDSDTASIELGSGVFMIEDDGPGATGNPLVLLDDDALSGGNPAGTGDDADSANIAGTLSHDFGTDGAGSIAFLTTGAPTGFTYELSGSNLLIKQGGTTVVTVTLNSATGAYTVAQDANIVHAAGANENNVEFTLNYIVLDGDNDPVPGTLVLNVDDDTPTATNVTGALILDDDAQPDGNPGGTDDVADNNSVTGAVGALFNRGADGVQSIAVTGPAMTAISVDVNGVATQEAVTWTSVNNVDGSVTVTGSSASIASVAVLTVNTDGSYSYTQNAPVVSSAPGTPGSEETDSFVFGITITDGDDDQASSDLTIQINDDTPTAFNDTNSLSEDTPTVGGNVLTDGSADMFGADGSASPAITAISGFGGAGSVGGSTTGEWGSLSLGVDGTYTYTLNTVAVQGLDDGDTETDTFTYSIQDGDGDRATATLTITINGANDAPVANADTNWTIEDAVAAITGDVLSNVSHPGAPSGSFADVADTDVDGDTLSVTTTGTFNGAYGVLTLNSDGTYSYSLYTQAQNATAYAAVQALAPGDAPLTDSFAYTASDGDDSANSTLIISIFGSNDAPIVGTSTVATSDEGLALGLPDTSGNPTDVTNLATASGTVSITDSDDTSFTVTLSLPTESLAVTDGSASGAPISWSLSPDGKSLTGSINTGTQTAITVVIDDAGAFTVTQLLPIFHPDTTSEDVLEFTVDVNVNDGTTTTTQIDAITVELEDDSPIPVVADDMTTSNVAGTIAVADLDSDDDVDNNFGGDDGKVIFTAASIAALEALGLTSGFAALDYSISADGTVLTAVKDGTTDTVFTLTLDPATNPDDYVLNLVQEIDSTSNIDFNDAGYDFVGGNNAWAGFNLPLVTGSQDLLLTPIESGVNAGSVNTNANEGGVSDGNSVKTGEAIRADFVIDLTGTPLSSGDYDDPGRDNHTFSGHYNVNGAAGLFTSITGGAAESTIRFSAFDDNDADNVVGDGTLDNIIQVVITYNGASQTITAAGSYSVGGQTFAVTFNGSGTVDVAGVVSDTRIAAFTADGYTSLEFENVGGRPFKIGDFGATSITDDPVSFAVPISVVDLDGDIVGSGDLDITLNAPMAAMAASAGGGSQGSQMFSTTAVMMDDQNGSGSPSNDNGSMSPGTSVFAFTSENIWQSELRGTGFSSVAAMSGAFMLSVARGNEIGPQLLFQQSDLMGSDQLVSNTGLADYLVQPTTVTGAKIDLLIGDGFAASTAGSDNILSGNSYQDHLLNGSKVTQDLADQRVDTLEIGLDDGTSVLAAANMPSSTDFGDLQVMEALLALQASEDATNAKTNAEFETVEVILSDLMNEQLVDKVIDSFTQGDSDFVDYFENHSLASAEGLLEQALFSTQTVQQSISLHDQQLDDAAMAATQA